MADTLMQFYNDLKSANAPAEDPNSILVNVTGPAGAQWRMKAAKHADCLRDKCCKHLIADIYCKILPLDDDYKCGHMGMMKQDIDNMLDNKGLSATQYLKSCSESTGSPFVKYLLDATNTIASEYMKECDAKLKAAQENNERILEAEEPELESEEISGALNDITEDDEYKMFIEKLRKKTADTIVNDISDVINKSKIDGSLQYDPKSESAVQMCADAITKKLWKEDVNKNGEKTEEILGLAIRESSLREIDKSFNVASPFNEFRTAVGFNKGNVITESAISELIK